MSHSFCWRKKKKIRNWKSIAIRARVNRAHVMILPSRLHFKADLEHIGCFLFPCVAVTVKQNEVVRAAAGHSEIAWSSPPKILVDARSSDPTWLTTASSAWREWKRGPVNTPTPQSLPVGHDQYGWFTLNLRLELANEIAELPNHRYRAWAHLGPMSKFTHLDVVRIGAKSIRFCLFVYFFTKIPVHCF